MKPPKPCTAEQVAQRHRRPFRQVVLGQLPAAQRQVDVAVERQLAARDRLERCQRGHHLADRRSLEHRGLGGALAGGGVSQPVGARPSDAMIVDDRDAHAGDVVRAQPLLDRPAALALDPHDGHEAVLDARHRIGERRVRRSAAQGEDQRNAWGA
jgi:hypothetical protein